jgi:hypothetical protein
MTHARSLFSSYRRFAQPARLTQGARTSDVYVMDDSSPPALDRPFSLCPGPRTIRNSGPDLPAARRPRGGLTRGALSLPLARKLGRLDIALGQLHRFRFDQAEDASSSRSDAVPAATNQQ